MKKMFELLAELFAYCWRLLKAELPDCVQILSELRSGERSIPDGSSGYLWLCRLTGFAALIRGVAIVWLLAAVSNLLLHFNFGWPPWSFQDAHNLYWKLGFAPGQAMGPWHFCLPLAAITMTTFVVTAWSYYGLAWASTRLVGMVVPVSEPTGRRGRVHRKRRKNEVA
jgi:hypothetical protein